jgi:hypothetical protein
MIREAFFTSIIFIFFTSCGTQKNSHQSKAYVSSEKVLIIGAGSIATKIFMENLSKNMANRLNKEKIASNSIFFENTKPGSRLNKVALDSFDYDAYIIFYPTDGANLVMNRTVPAFSVPRINAVAPNSYQQEFTVQIYMKADKTKPVSEMSLHVDLDPTDDQELNKISSYILNYLPL